MHLNLKQFKYFLRTLHLYSFRGLFSQLFWNVCLLVYCFFLLIVVVEKWINFKSLMAYFLHTHSHSYTFIATFIIIMIIFSTIIVIFSTFYMVFIVIIIILYENILYQLETLSYVYLHGKYVSISINITALNRILFFIHTYTHTYINKYIYLKYIF